MKTALQIYSVRNTLFEDLPGRLRELRAMGYDGVELVNFGGICAADVAAEMKKAGLEVFSIHTDLSEMLSPDEALLQRYAALGCRYMPIVSLPEERIAGGALYEEMLGLIRSYSARCKKYGIRLLYHNHDFDFALTGGMHKLDRLYADTDPEVLGCELDTCWIYSSGEDPLAYLRKYAGRCPVFHLKDCVAGGGRQGFMPVGQGVLDFPPMIKAAPDCGVEWLCVEQDEPCPGKTDMECAQDSIRYLRTLLEKN